MKVIAVLPGPGMSWNLVKINFQFCLGNISVTIRGKQFRLVAIKIFFGWSTSVVSWPDTGLTFGFDPVSSNINFCVKIDFEPCGLDLKNCKVEEDQIW